MGYYDLAEAVLHSQYKFCQDMRVEACLHTVHTAVMVKNTNVWVKLYTYSDMHFLS